MVEGAESLYARHADALERVLAYVCRRNRLSADDAADFCGLVRLKVVEHDYAVLRAFEGRSSAQTYLTVVVQRLYLDYRTQQWGKWRPSAEALRLGPTAVLYERLTHRDGLPPAEARAVMRANHQVQESEVELDALTTRLPVRVRRRTVADDALADMPGSSHDGESAVFSAERDAAWSRSRAALASVVAGLPPDERLIVTYRFDHGMPIAEISRVMRLEQKPLYRRLDAILRNLRLALEARGVDRDGVRAMFDTNETARVPGWTSAGNPEESPSL